MYPASLKQVTNYDRKMLTRLMAYLAHVSF